MRKEAFNFTDAPIRMTERSSAVRREMPLGNVLHRRSHWPFTVDDSASVMAMTNVDKPSLAHSGTGSFIS